VAKVPPEVSAYMARIGRKGGAKSIATVNANFTTEQRRKAGKKAADALTPAQRKSRASDAAQAMWAKKRAAAKAKKKG
jgi:hypothetical protein